MKATLEYNLPEELESFTLASKANDMQRALYDIYTYLRQHTKYAPESWHEERCKAFEEAREEFNRILSECGVDIC